MRKLIEWIKAHLVDDYHEALSWLSVRASLLMAGMTAFWPQIAHAAGWAAQYIPYLQYVPAGIPPSAVVAFCICLVVLRVIDERKFGGS